MGKFNLPDLPYNYDSLEPYIDATTMEIHHTKHHAGYVNNLNNAVAGTELEAKSLEELLANAGMLPVAVRNNGGGHFNHSLFWSIMGKDKGGNPTGKLGEDIDSTFGSFQSFKDESNRKITELTKEKNSITSLCNRVGM